MPTPTLKPTLDQSFGNNSASIPISQLVAESQGSKKIPISQLVGGTQPPASGGGFVGALKSGARSVIQSNVDDFQSAATLFNGQAYKSPQSIWSGLGGLFNAGSDVAIALGSLALNPEDAEVGAIPTDVAATAAKNAAEKGVINTARSMVPKALGKFAAGKGTGLVAQGISSGSAQFAKAKGEGQSTPVAAAEGVGTGLLTAGSFGLMNWLGPKVGNTFVKMVSGMGIKDFISKSLDKVVTTLSSAASSANKTATVGFMRDAVNSAASSVVKLNSTIFKNLSDGLSAPTNQEVDSMVGKMGARVTSEGNALVNKAFGDAKTALSPFAAKVGDISKIVGGAVAQGAEGVVKRGSEAYKAAQAAAMSGGEMSMEQALQTTIAGMKKDATVPVSDLLDIINAPTKSVRESQVKSAVWTAIRNSVGDDEEGLRALSQYSSAQSSRVRQTFTSGLMDAIRGATGNADVFAGGVGRAAQSSWKNLVSTVMDHLNTPQDVDSLRFALGSDVGGLQDFGKMLKKKIISDAMDAYRTVGGTMNNIDARYATPEIASGAAKAFRDSINTALQKVSGLNLLSHDDVSAFQDMAHAIPDVETIARNAGIDITSLADEAGKPLLQVEQEGKNALTLSEEEVNTVKNSPIGEFLSSLPRGDLSQADLRELPTNLLKSSSQAIGALQKALGGVESEAWKAVSASTAGMIMKDVAGLWEKDVPKIAEGTASRIETLAKGDKDVFEKVFGGEGKSMFSKLVDFSAALSKGSESKMARGAIKGMQATAFGLIHHFYGAAILATDAAKQFMSKDDISFLESIATQKDFNSAWRTYGASQEGVRGFLTKIANIMNASIAPVMKYEVGRQLPQELMDAIPNVLRNRSSGSPSENTDQ